MNNIVFENEKFRLELSSCCVAKSLILKSNGEECIYGGDKVPFFSLTEDRPYNNEIKLAHPTCRMTFGANRVRLENDRLIVGFELIDFEAVVKVKTTPSYIAFELVDFIVRHDSFGLGVAPILPPVTEFNMVQLSLTNRENFGKWLNVMWDDRVAVNVLSTSPYSYVGSEERKNNRSLFGKALRDIKLKGAGIALIVSEKDELLDAIDEFERDFDLPRGVESRRSPFINRSYYWCNDICEDNVDKHIEYAKKGGFKFMCINYYAFFNEPGGFKMTGDYNSFRPCYSNGVSDVKKILDKIKEAGIIPGLHLLHTHVGMMTHYLTPKADHRLNLTRHFTLAKPLSQSDTDIYVEENPDNCPVFEKMRVLNFMGELINYESYTTERPYRFTGCRRGFNGTTIREHEVGTIGGILDVSEFSSNSVYVNQKTSLQDELADDIARLYDSGFEFVYFDGSEGVNAPFDVNVGLAQWRVYKKLGHAPLFCEGAAKSHFSWHILSGGNAFDIWSPDTFKEMIAAHPFAEAPMIKKDFTRLNFGWWDLSTDTRADIMEYGTALAAAWDCPGAFISRLDVFDKMARGGDILEVLRRWESARETGFVTDEIKARLKDTETEHTLLIDEDDCLELADCYHIKDAFSENTDATAFVFERNGKACASCWHNTGRADISLSLNCGEIKYVTDFAGEELPVERTGDEIVLPIEQKRYIITDASVQELASALRKAKLL